MGNPETHNRITNIVIIDNVGTQDEEVNVKKWNDCYLMCDSVQRDLANIWKVKGLEHRNNVFPFKIFKNKKLNKNNLKCNKLIGNNSFKHLLY